MAAVSVRAVVRTFSELSITGGIVIVLFVVYFLYWTGVRADSAGEGEIGRLQDKWASGSVADGRPGGREPDGSGPGGEDGAADGDGTGGAGAAGGLAGPEGSDESADGAGQTAYPDGESFAVMYIPRFGDDWAKPVLENTGKQTLRKGLGHYEDTARLGAKGNFAVAGHRRTYGDPFKDFPQLRSGDAVVVSDGDTWYTYRIEKRPYKTLPSDVGVLNPLPEPVSPDAAPYDRPGRYLTLTTCEPEWGSSHRLIAWARLDATRPAAEGKPKVLTDLSG